jgi:hypothetical protein
MRSISKHDINFCLGDYVSKACHHIGKNSEQDDWLKRKREGKHHFPWLMLILIGAFSAHGHQKMSYLPTGAHRFCSIDGHGCPCWADFAHGQAHGPFAHGPPIDYSSLSKI